MKNILITGSNGFIAKNLISHLSCIEGNRILTTNRNTSKPEWESLLNESDIIIHLAGENRPLNPSDFKKGNTDLTEFILKHLELTGKEYKFLYASSTQAVLDNEYGKSKYAAEQLIQTLLKNGTAVIFRFPGVFGKWCRPSYNSVVATYCFNIANDIPVEIRDASFLLKLMYVDDVVETIMKYIQADLSIGEIVLPDLSPVYEITLGELASTLRSFKENRSTFYLPDVGNEIEKKLYSTYLSYLGSEDFAYKPILRVDERGSLFELLKSSSSGQIFMSTTKPGITRGNHFHHTKTEKFCVVVGKGLIQFRQINTDQVIEYTVTGEEPRIVDIPPGYTHNIKNIGDSDMVTLFWANEVFDPNKTDTYFEKV